LRRSIPSGQTGYRTYRTEFSCDRCSEGIQHASGRFRCLECSNYDLCRSCFTELAAGCPSRDSHQLSHPMDYFAGVLPQKTRVRVNPRTVAAADVDTAFPAWGALVKDIEASSSPVVLRGLTNFTSYRLFVQVCHLSPAIVCRDGWSSREGPLTDQADGAWTRTLTRCRVPVLQAKNELGAGPPSNISPEAQPVGEPLFTITTVQQARRFVPTLSHGWR
jgi:hypothetical protein